MKTVIKAIITTSYTASARDGAFIDNVSFNNKASLEEIVNIFKARM